MIGRLIDSLVSAVSPLSGLRRAQARKLLRSYQGGEPSRVASARNPKNQPADMELMGPFGADRLRAWARDMVRNNAYAWGVVDTIVSSVVGCGIKAQSTYETPEGEDIEELNDIRDKVWSEWCEVCDVNGQYTFEEMQAAIQREIVEAGEVLVRIVRTPENVFHGILRPVPLALELIEADRLAGDKDTYAARLSADSGNRIIRGVEVDDLGKPVAYWIYKDHPLQPYAFTRTPERIPANEVLHLFRRDRVGQTRGVTWFAPALSWIRDLGTYVDNELQASAVASCFTVAIKSHTPIGNLFDPDGGTGTDTAGNRQRYVEPGMIMELAPGEDVVGLNPGRPNAGAEPWIGLILRGIAVGTGLSYEVVARDYSQTSYSSSRTSQLEDRRRFRCWQQYLIRHLLQPVWDAFSDAAAISAIQGFATSTELLEDRRKFAPVEWQTPEWEWVDPQSEQTASEMALNSFTDTYQNVLGSRGRSFRSVFYQRAKEERMRKKLGLITPEERQQQISAAQTAAMAPAESPKAQSSPTQPQEQRQAGTGEMMGLSTLQFNRNRKAIAKTLQELADKTISQTQAKVFLSSIGMSPENVDALISDALDGTVDTKLPESSDAV
jgi:lambda family phage portal protein